MGSAGLWHVGGLLPAQALAQLIHFRGLGLPVAMETETHRGARSVCVKLCARDSHGGETTVTRNDTSTLKARETTMVAQRDKPFFKERKRLSLWATADNAVTEISE